MEKFTRRSTINVGGEVTLANGKTYDMTDKDDRQLAADEGKIYFYKRFVAAVKSVDPQILTCEGMYTLLAVGNYTDSDPNANYGLTPISDVSDAFPTTLDVMMKTDLDFFDVHVYHTTAKELVPVFGENMRSLKYNDEVKAGQAKKPIIMAEFGAFRSKAPTFEEGKQIIVEQRDIALGDGYHFQGFMAWQLNEFKQTELYALLEDDAKFFEGEMRYVYLEKAELLADGAKIEYVTNETLDLSGVQIKCYYSDGTEKLVNATEDMIWNSEELDMSVAGSKTIELLFEEQMILAYDIEVEQGTAPPAENPGDEEEPGQDGEKDPSDTGQNDKGGCAGSAGLQMFVAGTAAVLSAICLLAKKRKNEI